jgi:hypothetical protein
MATNNRVFLVALGLAMLLCLSAAYAQAPVIVEVRPADQSATGALMLIDGKLAPANSVEMAARGQQVMVWIRELEKLGWGTVLRGDSPEKTKFKTKTVTLTFSKNSSAAMVNSLSVQLPIETYLRDGKLMVPLSFVAKSLGYSFDLAMRPVATISTTPPPAASKSNGIRGQVLYHNKGVGGIKVALVDPDYNTVKGFQSVTGPNGDYAFDSVPDGKYLAYVWVGHNPDYFNRVSEEAELSGGKIAELTPINLGRIIRPIRPKEDQAIPAAAKILFAWTACEGAASYKLVVTKQGSAEELVALTTTKPKAEVVTKKLLPGNTYVADIEARDADGRFLGGTIGAGGKIWTFSIIGNRQ